MALGTDGDGAMLGYRTLKQTAVRRNSAKKCDAINIRLVAVSCIAHRLGATKGRKHNDSREALSRHYANDLQPCWPRAVMNIPYLGVAASNQQAAFAAR